MTEQWHSKDLGDGVDSIEHTEAIIGAFGVLHRAVGQPQNMAVFSRYDPAAQVVTAYFTPEASGLAMVFGADPCQRPDGRMLGVLVGGRLAIARYFPDGIGQGLYART